MSVHSISTGTTATRAMTRAAQSLDNAKGVGSKNAQDVKMQVTVAMVKKTLAVEVAMSRAILDMLV